MTQKSCTNFCCFLCEWDSRAKSVNFSKKNWPLHTLYTPGRKNVAHEFLVDRCKVLLPTLHIKLGPMKNFAKVPERNDPAFSVLCEKIPRLSTETIKAGVFTGLQIRQFFADLQIDLALSDDEKSAFNTFRHVTTVFHRKCKSRQLQETCGGSYNFLREAWLHATCRSKCISSIRAWFPIHLTVVL